MSNTFIQWAALAGMIAIGVVFIIELRRWRSLEMVIRPKHRSLRVLMLAMMEALFLLMFIGPWVTSGSNPLLGIAYWSLCMLIGVVVILLAMLDLRAVTKGYAALNRRMFDEYRRERRDR